MDGPHHAQVLIELGVSTTFCYGWPQTTILPISATQITRITGINYLCLVLCEEMKTQRAKGNCPFLCLDLMKHGQPCRNDSSERWSYIERAWPDSNRLTNPTRPVCLDSSCLCDVLPGLRQDLFWYDLLPDEVGQRISFWSALTKECSGKGRSE
jgi:hypothetical protein